jgi:uncharacterized membrane protein
LVFGIVTLTGYEQFIKNSVDVGAEVGQVRALRPDEVSMDRIELVLANVLVLACISHDGYVILVVSKIGSRDVLLAVQIGNSMSHLFRKVH